MRVHWVTDYDHDGNRLGFSLHNRLARRAAGRVRERYTWRHTGRRLLEILEEVTCLQAAI